MELNFGEMIRQGRLAKGWTMQELGAVVERSKNQIYDLEKGRTCPVQHPSLLAQLALTLELDLVSFYGAALQAHHQWELPSVLLEQVAERALVSAKALSDEPPADAAWLEQVQAHGLQSAQSSQTAGAPLARPGAAGGL